MSRQTTAAFDLMGRGIRAGSAARILTVAGQFAASVVVARLLGPEGVGVYGSVVAAAGLVISLGTLQLASQSARHDTARWAGESAGVAVTAGIASATVGAAAAVLFAAVGRHQQATALAAFLPVLALAPALELSVGGLNAAGEAAWTAGLRAARVLTRLLGILAVALVAGGREPWSIAVLDSVAIAVVVVAAVLRLRAETTLDLRLRTERLREAARAAPALIGASLVGVVIQRADVLMLSLLDGLGATGRYEVALRITEVPMLLHVAALVTFLPSVARTDRRKELRALYARVTVLTSLLLVPPTIWLGLWGDRLAAGIFGTDFMGPRWVYALLALGVAVQVLTGPSGALLVARRRHRALLTISTVVSVLAVALNALLIPPFGTRGAAAATALSFCVVNGLYLLVGRRHLDPPPGAWRRLPVLLAGYLAACGLVGEAGRQLVGPHVRGAAASAAGLALLAAALGCTPPAREALGLLRSGRRP